MVSCSLHRNVQRFRGGLVFKAHRLCVSLNSRLDSNTEQGEKAMLNSKQWAGLRVGVQTRRSSLFPRTLGTYSRTVPRALWWP